MTNAPSHPASRGPAAPRPGGLDLPAVRRDRAARLTVRRWRELLRERGPAGATTLVACSGGADSVALLLALRASTARLVVGHVVHVLRPRREELADRDAVRSLAAALGLDFFESEIETAARGNMEAAARRLRYDALRRMAVSAGATAVVTAHHADDQLESIVLALVRGAGPAGLSGVAPARSLGGGVTLVRPMLGCTRAEAQRICRIAGAAWSEDSTNTDERRARSRVRRQVAPALHALRPGAAARAARSAELLRDAAGLVHDRVRDVFGERDHWPRAALRAERPIVLGAGLRLAIVRELGDDASSPRAADRLGARAIDPVIRAIRDASTEPRRFGAGPPAARVTILVTSREVSVRREARE